MMTRPHARRGGAAVELALCMIFVLVPMTAAVIEWGWYFYREISIQQLARDAARVGVSDAVSDSGRDSAAQAWAETRLSELGFDSGTATVDVVLGADSITVGTQTRDLLRVTITAEYEQITGLLPDGANPPENLTATYEMRS